MSSLAPRGERIHLGMDTSKNTIVVGVLLPDEEIPVVDRVFNDDRLMHHAHLIVTTGDSFRFTEAKNGGGVTPLVG